MDPLNVLADFEVRSFTLSRDNSDWIFWWGANPNLGKGRPYGVEERALVSSYRPPIVTFPLSLRVSEIKINK